MEKEMIVKQNTNDLSNLFHDSEQFNTALRGAAALAKSSIVPAEYQNRPENCLIAVNLAKRMDVDPMIVMQNLYVVRGKPSWSGQACRMLIQNCGKFKDLKHVYVSEEGKDSWGCYLTATRLSDGETVKGSTVTIATAKKEGWVAKGGSKWITMPELMLAYRASAWFARVHCPEALMGMQTMEEVIDVHDKMSKDKINDTEMPPEVLNFLDLEEVQDEINE